MQPRGRRVSLFLVAFAALILIRAGPLARVYVVKLLSLHSLRAVAGAVVAAGAAYLALVRGIARHPKGTAAAGAAVALLLVGLSGNAVAVAAAAGILAGTFLVGDAVTRLLRGREAGEGDLSSVFAAGVVTLGLAPLALGEVGLWRPAPLLLGFSLLLALRWRRLPSLARLASDGLRLPRGDAAPALEAAWLAVVALFLAAAWVGTLSPDFSWDALTYHLPEARDLARSGSVEPILGLAPQSLLWHNEENFLSLGFLFGGERVARFLHFFVGLGAFGAALALARRIGAGGSRPLVLLALAAFPTAILQLRATYVDWTAAFLVTAAAAEIAASREDRRRLLLAGFLFGGAIVTKLFAILAGPALLILFLRRGGLRASRLALAAAGVLLALLPWLAWSQSRAGFFLTPFWSAASVPSAVSGQFLSSRVHNVEARDTSLLGFLRLSYDLTFHSHIFEKNGDGYDGMLPLLLVPGVFGSGLARLGLFLAGSLPVLVPWFRVVDPSVRYLIPLYPLYALAAAHGVSRGTARFAGRAGLAAGIALAATALSFPVELGSTGVEWKVAAGRLSREQALNERLPSYRFWKNVRPEDRVIFLGEYDRFHCTALWVWRANYHPIRLWRFDPARWRRGLRVMRIDWLVVTLPLPVNFLDSLGDAIVLVDRNGPSLLYRVQPETAAAGDR